MATIAHRGTDSDGKEIWRIRVFVDGKQKSITYHGSERGAQRTAAAAENRREQGETVTPTKMKVGDYLSEWLETYQKHEVAKITYAEDTGRLRRHILPEIGEKRMATLTTMDCQRTVNRLTQQGKARSAVMVFNLLKKSLRKAVELGYLVKNPMDAVTKPKDRAQERPALTDEQATAFLEAAKEDTLYSFFAFLLHTGARPEEAQGLRWIDVDFEKRVICFRRAMKRLPGGGWEFAEMKTTSSVNDFPMNEELIGILRAHKKEQARLRLAMGTDWADNGLAFTNQAGNPVDVSKARKHLKAILTSSRLPTIRLYDLRHTFGSTTLQDGTDIKTVSRLMRHASITTTARYMHGNAETDRAAVERRGKRLKRDGDARNDHNATGE